MLLALYIVLRSYVINALLLIHKVSNFSPIHFERQLDVRRTYEQRNSSRNCRTSIKSERMEEQPQVAPYGGLLTKTLEDEKNQEKKLEEQAIEVTYNDKTEIVRPEALHVRGVDSLSTEDIKAYIDYYVNFNVTEKTVQDGEQSEGTKFVYEPLPIDEQTYFRIQWVNDTSVNITFKSMEKAHAALLAIVLEENLDGDEFESLSELDRLRKAIEERPTKSYKPIIEFKKHMDLKNRLNIGDTNGEANAPEEDKGMDEDDTAIELFVRQSFQSDRKVKNASAYSRYYLLHGEPERKPYHPRKRRHDNRRSRGRRGDDEEEDLFAYKMNKSSNANDDDDDLFADKLKEKKQNGRSRSRSRSRSPMRIER